MVVARTLDSTVFVKTTISFADSLVVQKEKFWGHPSERGVG